MLQGRINLLLRSFDARELLGILTAISSNTHGVDDIDQLTEILNAILGRASVVGYVTQSELAGLQATTRGVQLAADNIAPLVRPFVERIEAALAGNPERQPLIQAVVAEGASREGLSEGQKAAAVEHQLTRKQWMHLGAPKEPRLDHLALDGTIIGVDEYFDLGDGQQVLMPHDWTIDNPAAHWMWCGCQAIYLP